jgi:hypothetical protein
MGKDSRGLDLESVDDLGDVRPIVDETSHGHPRVRREKALIAVVLSPPRPKP